MGRRRQSGQGLVNVLPLIMPSWKDWPEGQGESASLEEISIRVLDVEGMGIRRLKISCFKCRKLIVDNVRSEMLETSTPWFVTVYNGHLYYWCQSCEYERVMRGEAIKSDIGGLLAQDRT